MGTLYQNHFKRILDITLSGSALIVLSPVMGVTALLVKKKLGSPVIFKQKRPGKDEKIFTMYKFRTMTDERDGDGNLLPDDIRLTKFGKTLRSTSLDELPELVNILKGDMSVVGPRPQLVRDMVFMSDEQRKRHTVRPGLTGLAQVNGRNNISWEDKFEWDLKYVERITFVGDIKTILLTFNKVFQHKDIVRDGTLSDVNYGDWLIQEKGLSKEEYTKKIEEATELLILQ